MKDLKHPARRGWGRDSAEAVANSGIAGDDEIPCRDVVIVDFPSTQEEKELAAAFARMVAEHVNAVTAEPGLLPPPNVRNRLEELLSEGDRARRRPTS